MVAEEAVELLERGGDELALRVTEGEAQVLVRMVLWNSIQSTGVAA